MAIVGPVVGGTLAENGQWRWIFWLNLPLCGCAFLILPLFAQLKPKASGPVFPMIRQIDWVGYFLFGASLVSVLLGISWGGILHAWSNAATFLPILLGAVGFLLLILWSWFSPFAPILNFRSFLNATTLSIYLSSFFQGIIVSSTLCFLVSDMLVSICVRAR
jgi:MFS family permease